MPKLLLNGVGARSSKGIAGYKFAVFLVLFVPIGDAGHTCRFAPPSGLLMSRSNVVWKGARRGGVGIMLDVTVGFEEINLIVVVRPGFAPVPVLNRAFVGAGAPGRAEVPGMGSSSGEVGKSKGPRLEWSSFMGVCSLPLEVPRVFMLPTCEPGLLLPARLIPNEFAIAAFKDDLTESAERGERMSYCGPCVRDIPIQVRISYEKEDRSLLEPPVPNSPALPTVLIDVSVLMADMPFSSTSAMFSITISHCSLGLGGCTRNGSGDMDPSCSSSESFHW